MNFQAYRIILAALFALAQVACDGQPSGTTSDERNFDREADPAFSTTASLPPNPSLEAEAVAVSSSIVRFTIETNLPLPIEVMVDVSLADLAPTDTWVGHQARITLNEQVTVFELDTSQARWPLPNAEYEAEVSFYPRWGAELNPAAQNSPELHWTGRLTLEGSGETRSAVVRRNELRSWVIDNVVIGTPWDANRFTSRLGEFESWPADLNRHQAYYFPAADMTIIVNGFRDEVAIWRMGRANR